MQSEARQLSVQHRARRRSARSYTWSAVVRATPTCASACAASPARSAIRSTSRGRARASTRATRSSYSLSATTSFDFDPRRTGTARSARGTPYTPDRRRRHQRRRLLERPRVHLRSGDDRRPGARRRRCGRSSRTARGSARDCLESQIGTARGAQPLPGAVDVDGEPHLLVQSGEGADAAAREDLVPDLQSARRRRRAACTARATCTAGDSSSFPIEQLLFVRGFDPATQRYKYEVNPALRRDGAVADRDSARRSTLTAMLRVDVGPTRERQELTQLLDRGRTTQGTKAPEPLLRALYGPAAS